LLSDFAPPQLWAGLFTRQAGTQRCWSQPTRLALN